MAFHTLESTPETVTQVFSRDIPPALSVDPGDEIIVYSLDALGHLRRFEDSGDNAPRLLGDRPGLSVPGPIEVRGACPGMMLAVQLIDLRPVDWGWTASALKDSALNHRLGLSGHAPTWLLWDLDAEKGIARSREGFSVNLSPFLGIIGVPPPEPGAHSLLPPYESGGNLDCRDLVAGSTLYVPVTVPGAMLCLGDGHGAQGDGEVSGTAIECGMRSTIKVDLITDPAIPTLHAETPSGRITFGLSTDLNEAAAQALEAMLDWMQLLYDVDRATALALASPSVDLRITQIAAPVWGVHAVLPPCALRRV